MQFPSYLVGPGLVLITICVLANLKAIPLVHSIRLLPSVYRILKARSSKTPRIRQVQQTAPSSKTFSASSALFKHHITTSRAILLDLDINIHKSNSTFFTDADISRASLLTKLLSPALASLGATFILAGVQCKFKREIRPYQTYAVSSRVLSWDERSFWIVTWFLKPGTQMLADVEVLAGPAAALKDERIGKGVFAVMVSKYVFKAGRRTMAPAEVWEEAGLLVAGSEKGTGEGDLDAQMLVRAKGEGMQFVKDCML